MRDARVVTLKNRRKWCEMRRGATCCVGGARCEGVRDAHNNVISVLGVRDAKGCEMRIFLGGCESLCPQFDLSDEKYVIVLRAFFEGINFRYLVFIWRPAKPRSTFVLKSKASKVALQRYPFKFSGKFLA